MSILGLEGLALSPRLPNISVSYEDFRMSQKTWRSEFVDICVSTENDDGQGQAGIWARLKAFLVKMKDLMVKMVHKVKDYCRQLLAIIAKYLVKFRNWYQTKKGFRPFKYTGYPIDTNILDKLNKEIDRILFEGLSSKTRGGHTWEKYTAEKITEEVKGLLDKDYGEHIVRTIAEAESLMKMAEKLGEKAQILSAQAYGDFNDFISNAASVEKANKPEEAKAIRKAAKTYYAVMSKICMRFIRTMFSIVRHAKVSLEDPDSDLRSQGFPPKLIKAIHEGNDIHARTAIIGLLDHDDRNPSEIYSIALKAEKLFKEKNVELFEPDDHIVERPSREEWTRRTLIKVKAALLTNFSKEKVKLGCEIKEQLKTA